MKLYLPGEKSRAMCQTDGLVSTTFAYRDVPFDDGRGEVQDILVGVCDRCGGVVSIPPQSTPAIKAAREKAVVSVEASLPAVYLDALDLACHRIDPSLTVDFRKRLVMYYVHTLASDRKLAESAVRTLAETKLLFGKAEKEGRRKRLSMKVTPAMSREIDAVMEATSLTKTDLIKSVVGQIHKDIVVPEQPKRLKALKALAAVAAC